ncbi:hypothetical protein A7982_12400 [Minicystis rosea]|nr:hypothetical protein A7982_12400 [Minicystis rosea]
MHRLIFLLVGIFVVALPLPALASPPCDCEVPWLTPRAGSSGVPRNARITVTDARVDRTGIHLFKQEEGGGTPTEIDVPVHVDDIIPGGPFAIVPDQELEADTTYVARSGEGGEITRFTTGASSDTAPPTFKAVSIVGNGAGGACPRNIAAMVLLDQGADDTTPETELAIRVDLSAPSRALLLSPSFPFLGRMLAEEELACLNNVPDAETGETFTGTITVLDWAGNASVKTPSTFEYTEQGGLCGCVLVGGPAPSGLGMTAVAFAIALLRRRRTR